MSASRYLPAAQFVAREFPGILARSGRQPCIDRYVLTESTTGDAWLFVVLEVSAGEDPVTYADSEVLRYLSAELHGLPVVFCGSDVLRYAVLLNPYLPASVADTDGQAGGTETSGPL